MSTSGHETQSPRSAGCRTLDERVRSFRLDRGVRQIETVTKIARPRENMIAKAE
jgi:hypothetical protein